jgi:hypothetical protein
VYSISSVLSTSKFENKIMKDIKKVSPNRYRLLQDIEAIQMDIENTQIGYDMLMSDERKEVRMQLEFLYQRRAELKRALRKEG